LWCCCWSSFSPLCLSGRPWPLPFSRSSPRGWRKSCRGRVPLRSPQWLLDFVRVLGHAALLLVLWLGLLLLSFLPGLGHVLWLVGSWLLRAYNFAAFALERRRWSFREQWRCLLRAWATTLGFGAAVFVLLLLPLLGLVLLPTAAVGGHSH
jgi:uncharacterized protein involved in cysteine biosynthesis